MPVRCHSSRHLHIIKCRNSTSDLLQASTFQSNHPTRIGTPPKAVHGFFITRNVQGGRRQCVYVYWDFLSTAAPNLALTNATFAQVGINYQGTPRELNGCVNDAKNVRKFLISAFCAPSCTTTSLTPPARQRAGVLNQKTLLC